mmetsp:Transcript_19115/g.55571  ORF Transcript_19115/g.55571 Transcript_19115/m.55571 type:complete len:287 (-) Transcript_19115:679-1539(-)
MFPEDEQSPGYASELPRPPLPHVHVRPKQYRRRPRRQEQPSQHGAPSHAAVAATRGARHRRRGANVQPKERRQILVDQAVQAVPPNHPPVPQRPAEGQSVSSCRPGVGDGVVGVARTDEDGVVRGEDGHDGGVGWEGYGGGRGGPPIVCGGRDHLAGTEEEGVVVGIGATDRSAAIVVVLLLLVCFPAPLAFFLFVVVVGACDAPYGPLGVRILEPSLLRRLHPPALVTEGVRPGYCVENVRLEIAQSLGRRLPGVLLLLLLGPVVHPRGAVRGHQVVGVGRVGDP